MKNKETAIRECMRLNIISKRKEFKMRQEDLANKLGVKKNTVSSWEQGLSSPDIDTIATLLKLFNMNFYEFTGITNDSPSEILADFFGVSTTALVEEPENIILSVKEQMLILGYRDSDETTRNIVDKILLKNA